MNPGTNGAVLALFVRIPVPGRVKTRLIPGLGAEGACHLYRAMVEDILVQARKTDLPILLFHDEGDISLLPVGWRNSASDLIRQQGADLGARMESAFVHCWAQADRVVLIGSDIPGLEARLLREAAVALHEMDAVIAPATDGGYCMIGFNRAGYCPAVFDAVPWSTDQVLAMTLQRLEQHGRRVRLLDTLQDIDTIEDLCAYRLHPCPSAITVNRLIPRLLPAPLPFPLSAPHISP
jgi:rSAM/selenodomain-associated transferase 1